MSRGPEVCLEQRKPAPPVLSTHRFGRLNLRAMLHRLKMRPGVWLRPRKPTSPVLEAPVVEPKPQRLLHRILNKLGIVYEEGPPEIANLPIIAQPGETPYHRLPEWFVRWWNKPDERMQASFDSRGRVIAIIDTQVR